MPIYQRHPSVDRVAICEIDDAKRQRVGDAFGVEDRFASFEEALRDDRYNAFHILSPVPWHVGQTLAVLRSGRHCACAVPMATSIPDIEAILDAQRASGTNYMMMETAAYTREFLFAESLRDAGELGNLTFLRGTYYQDLECPYPRYWWAMPPMHYSTHAVGPLLKMAQTRMTQVNCLGSGKLAPHLQQERGNTFPLQTGIFRLDRDNLAAEITRSWFQVAHGYTEAFSVYGDRAGFEWQQIESEEPVVFTLDPIDWDRRWRDATPRRINPPYRPDLLLPELRPFAEGGHGGAHPHLVQEWIGSIVESREPAIGAVTSADWTAPGICAHESALLNGARVAIPAFN